METQASDDETTVPPTSKAELLGRIRREHAALEQTIARLSDDQMLAAAEHDWTVKDLLAHITAWEQVTLLVHLANQPFHEAIDLPGVIRIFLSDGTLVQDSCWETHRLSKWAMTGDADLSWNEDGMDIAASIISVNSSELHLQLQLGSDKVDEYYTTATVPYVCPDIPKT